eukprot:TCONS_00064676-protein
MLEIFLQIYTGKKDIIKEVNNGFINEMQLWHGTNEKAASLICHQSFDPRLVKNCLFGEGAYFSYLPNYSMNLIYSKPGTGELCNLFLADVLVGYSALVIMLITYTIILRLNQNYSIFT